MSFILRLFEFKTILGGKIIFLEQNKKGKGDKILKQYIVHEAVKKNIEESIDAIHHFVSTGNELDDVDVEFHFENILSCLISDFKEVKDV